MYCKERKKFLSRGINFHTQAGFDCRILQATVLLHEYDASQILSGQESLVATVSLVALMYSQVYSRTSSGL